MLTPIFLIDDSPDDLCLTKHLIGGIALQNPIVTIDSGEQAIELMDFAMRKHLPELIPCIIFCDIHMPIVDGFDVLRWVRNHDAFMHAVFAFLTGEDIPQ